MKKLSAHLKEQAKRHTPTDVNDYSIPRNSQDRYVMYGHDWVNHGDDIPTDKYITYPYDTMSFNHPKPAEDETIHQATNQTNPPTIPSRTDS